MEIKYEAVFGPQELFDGMMGACEFASEEYGYKFANGALYYCERYNEKAGWALSCKSHLTFKPSAMRRIIAEPKRWTLEDKKAGMLPDVGCKVDTLIGECMIIGADLNLKHVAVQYHDGHMDILHISKIKPIETPEDKAQREEDEFVSLVESEYNKMPNEISFRAGIRAAYRKLKGGE